MSETNPNMTPLHRSAPYQTHDQGNRYSPCYKSFIQNGQNKICGLPNNHKGEHVPSGELDLAPHPKKTKYNIPKVK